MDFAFSQFNLRLRMRHHRILGECGNMIKPNPLRVKHTLSKPLQGPLWDGGKSRRGLIQPVQIENSNRSSTWAIKTLLTCRRP